MACSSVHVTPTLTSFISTQTRSSLSWLGEQRSVAARNALLEGEKRVGLGEGRGGLGEKVFVEMGGGSEGWTER
jgi:hypothetical protein